MEPSSRKRSRDDVQWDRLKLSEDYNLDMIEPADKKHVEGILSFLIFNTELEFNIAIEAKTSSYVVRIMNIETFSFKTVETLTRKLGAFISNINFNFPKSLFEIVVRKNDSPMNAVVTGLRHRKRLRLIAND